MSHSTPKQHLTIHLAEPLVFLRQLPDLEGHRHHEYGDAPPAVIRGLLTLHLTKPTRISSIELTLEGKSTVQWSEGTSTGPRNTEENTFLNAHTILFSATTYPSFNATTRESCYNDELTHAESCPNTTRSRFSFGNIPILSRPDPPDPYRRQQATMLSAPRALHPYTPRRHDKGTRSTFGKLTAVVGLNGTPPSSCWTEFGRGTYTYPISFAIPSDTPPTIHYGHGDVTYRLKAIVHRPGALATKVVTSTEVVVVASPPDPGSEDTHPIIINRQWDAQLQYLITIEGRSFPIGAQIPFTLAITPLETCKIYRLSIFLEEIAQYQMRTRNSTRLQPPKRFELLSLTTASPALSPILPLQPADSALLTPYLTTSPTSSPGDALASLMNPSGPWILHHNLQLPTECSRISFTYTHTNTRISIKHILKIIFRVEHIDNSAEVEKMRKRRLVDIVVQTPIHILSCHCNDEQTALPCYSPSAHLETGASATTYTCACSCRNILSQAGANVDLGRENACGEAPPGYTEVVAPLW